MKVTMLLCDYAQVSENKLSVLGGGWSSIGPLIGSFCIGILFHVGWEEMNSEYPWRIELIDADGRRVEASYSDSSRHPVLFEGHVTLSRDERTTPGQSITVPLALEVPAGLPLEAGSSYEWRMWIAGETDEAWRLPFRVLGQT